MLHDEQRSAMDESDEESTMYDEELSVMVESDACSTRGIFLAASKGFSGASIFSHLITLF